VHLVVNGEERALEEETALPDFLRSFGLDSRRIAIAHNGTVLYREDWPSIMLREGDRLEIVRMIGGGVSTGATMQSGKRCWR
jgi:thiamine biosynthesis protein ThiS